MAHVLWQLFWIVIVAAVLVVSHWGAFRFGIMCGEVGMADDVDRQSEKQAKLTRIALLAEEHLLSPSPSAELALIDALDEWKPTQGLHGQTAGELLRVADALRNTVESGEMCA